MARLTALFLAFVLTACVPNFSPSYQRDARISQMLAPTVRVLSGSSIGSGTAIIRTQIGTVVVTNNHVVVGTINANARLRVERYSHGPNGSVQSAGQHEAIVLKTIPERDLALILVLGVRDIPLASLSPADDTALGDEVYTVGAQLGRTPHITRGLFSLPSEEINGQRWILHSSPTLPGNSGGGLYRMRNGRYELIGVPSMVMILGMSPAATVALSVPIGDVRAMLTANGYSLI